MGIFAEDLNKNYDQSHNETMCTGCGEIVNENNTYFIKGKSCCIKCINQ